MLALLLIAVLGNSGDCSRAGERCQMGRGKRGFRDAPDIEFGRGGKGLTSGACACVAVTTSRGDALITARASAGTCMKTGIYSGIANGDLVVCSANLPRIMPGATGTGQAGILSEQIRTNSVIRSAELDNVAWTVQDNVVGAPVVTANAAVAPDGTTTAEQIDFPVVANAGEYAEVSSTTFASITGMSSLFVKGFDGGSGSLHFTQYKTVQANSLAGDCAFVGDSWTRCYGVSTATQIGLAIGPNRLYPTNSTNAPAQSVYVWGADVQSSIAAYGGTSSHIPTTSAAATRAAETSSVTTNLPAFTLPISFAATSAPTHPAAHTADSRYLALGNVTHVNATLMWKSNAGVFQCYTSTGAVSSDVLTISNMLYPSTYPMSCSYGFASTATSSTIQGKHNNAFLADSAFGVMTQTAPTWLTIGYSTVGGALSSESVMANVCIDARPSRCRR